MAKYQMSFWNYVHTGVLNPKEAVADWQALGMNLATSFHYDPTKHKKKDFLKMLNECKKRNIQVIVCDKRTDFVTIRKIGKEAFEENVKQAVRDFGSHPATFGFHVGDEPNKAGMEDMIFAYKTVKKYAPHLKHFVNLLPIWHDDGFEKSFGFPPSGYKAYLDEIVKEAGLDILSYDCYAQCCYFEQDKYQDVYLENLKVFGEVARENNIPLYTSLLSVGHWSLRCPNEDDFRWQLSTATAMGCTGFLWFFIYERFYDNNFRVPPIDLFWEKTETFEWLSRQNRIFMRFIAPQLQDYTWESVKTLNTTVCDLPQFEDGDYGVKKIQLAVNETAPLMIANFKGEKDNRVVIVNLERQLPTSITVTVKNGDAEWKHRQWLAAGQILTFRVRE